MIEYLSKDKDELLECLVLYTKLFHTPYTAEALVAGLPVDKDHQKPELFSSKSSKGLFSRAAKRAGLNSRIVKKEIDLISTFVLPVILPLKGRKACILVEFNKDRTKALVILPETGETENWVNVQDLKIESLGYVFYLKKNYVFSNREHTLVDKSTGHWFWGTLLMSSKIYRDIIIASLLINLALLATPLYTMNIYDRVVPNDAVETLWVMSIGVVIIYIFDLIMKLSRGYFMELAAKKSDIIISSQLFEKVLDLRLEYKPRSIGSFANILRDFDSIRSFISSSTLVALVDLPFLVIFLAVIWILGGVLVMIPIVTMVLILIYIAWIKYPLQKSIEETHQATALKNSVLIESLVNLETIKYLGANGHAQWNWEEANGHISSKSQTSKLITASIPTVTNFMVQLATVIIVIVGVYEIYEKAMTMGALMGIVMLTSRALAPMSQIAALSTNYENVKKSYTELNKIMEMPCERPVDKQFIQRSNFEGVIEFKDVKFNYPDEEKASLINASFKINKGEKVAIIGRIGSGKTTIQKLILGLYQPTEGSILIDGIDIKQIDPVNLRKHIAYVPQDIYLFKGTVRDNIIYRDFSADNAAIIQAARISGVEEFVDKYPKGYDMPVGERGEGISGGQRQSIAIARAFINDTPMILLDEPTNMMDSTSEERIKANFKEATVDKTLVLVTHKKSLLDLVDRIIVVDEGRIILDGKKEDVIAKLAGNVQ